MVQDFFLNWGFTIMFSLFKISSNMVSASLLSFPQKLDFRALGISDRENVTLKSMKQVWCYFDFTKSGHLFSKDVNCHRCKEL